MRAKEFFKLLEAKTQEPAQAIPGDPASDPLYSLKLAIAHKIKELEPDEQTQHALDEINDVLSTVKLGGRRKSALTDLTTWSDSDVVAAKELLAKYIVSLDAPVEYKKSMLTQWKEGGLINVDLLLKGTHTIDQIVRGYTNNPAIKELTDDLLQVASIGKGKGEFMLKVLSPRIKNPSENKGDIEIVNFGTVEVKTTDGGAGRFYDRQVKPGTGYQSAVNDFIKTFKPYADDQPAEPTAVAPQPVPNAAPAPQPTVQPEVEQPVPTVEAKAKVPKIPKGLITKTGINLDGLITLYGKLTPEMQAVYKAKLTEVLDQIFIKVPEYAGAVVTAITSGNSGKAKQLYGVGVLNNYMAHKTDAGILYIDLTINPATFTFFVDNASLNAGGLRLHVGTAYPISNDGQYAYPQTSIVSTSNKEQPVV
jgi:nucleoid DNA-binding protein